MSGVIDSDCGARHRHKAGEYGTEICYTRCAWILRRRKRDDMAQRKNMFCGFGIICIVGVFALFSGCMWGRVKVNDPSVVDSARFIKPGSTHISELENILKVQPTFRMPGKDMILLGYTYSDTKNNGLMLIAVNFMRSTTVTDASTIAPACLSQQPPRTGNGRRA